MACVTYDDMCHYTLNILWCGQKNLNKKLVAKGNIVCVEKRVDLADTVAVKEDEVLPMVMCNVTNQHKSIIMARRIVGEHENNTREA